MSFGLEYMLILKDTCQTLHVCPFENMLILNDTHYRRRACTFFSTVCTAHARMSNPGILTLHVSSRRQSSQSRCTELLSILSLSLKTKHMYTQASATPECPMAWMVPSLPCWQNCHHKFHRAMHAVVACKRLKGQLRR